MNAPDAKSAAREVGLRWADHLIAAANAKPTLLHMALPEWENLIHFLRAPPVAVGASAVEALRREVAQLKEELSDARSTLNAWFDRRHLDEAEIVPLFIQAVEGYLRVCHSGGMPKHQSDMVAAVLPAFAEQHLVPALEPVLNKLRNVVTGRLK